jgi:hypothetical protein
VTGGRFSWLGGRPDAKADAASVRRARAHRRNATKVDRAGWAALDQRDRRLYGD